MKIWKKWISFIEIIVSVAIIVIIAVVAVTTHTSMVDKTNNSKIVSDMSTLENSLTSYKNDTSKIPTPSWNLKYFKEDTSYAHSSIEAFWVSWFVTEKTIPAKYINYLPLDPKTWQYYALSSTIDEKSFELAWVVKNNESYKSKVSWNWSWESWPYNLIREYNWPDFVYDEATSVFPYNPEELLLTAKISNFSWSVLINDKNYTEDEILSFDLKEWDKINIWTWSYAEMYLSDWSYSSLWDESSNTEIILANMRYVEKNNIFTNIKIALNVWSIWTKASKLWEKSNYEIYTTDSVASVRWTIFWVRSNWNKSDVIVLQWEVQVNKINSIPEIISWSDFENLSNAIQNDKIEEIQSENIWEISWITNWSWVIVVEWWEESKALEIQKDATWTNSEINEISWSWVIEKLPDDMKENIENNLWDINNSIKLELLWIENNSRTDRKVKIKLTDTLKRWRIVNINEKRYDTFLPTTSDILLLESEILKDNIVNISICKKWKCTKELKVDFNKITSFNQNTIDEYQDPNCDEHMLEDWVCNYDFKLLSEANYNDDFEMRYLSWMLNWDKWYLNSDVCDNNQQNNIELCNQLGSHTLLQKNVTNNSILYSFSWWITWVYLDNINNDDYLKYDISDLDLNSWSWFAIEMSVRGGALNRTSWIYFLSTTNTSGNFLLWLYNWDLYFWKTIANSIKIPNGTLQSLWNDDFYRIIATYNTNWIELQIKNRDWLNLTWSPIKSPSIIPTFNNNIFIWSNNSFQYQWNDIIDYVKIYKQ